MSAIEGTLTDHRLAVAEMITAAERSAASWTTPRAPGKWSPSQLVEHVALTLEESANVVDGAPSKFPKIPSFIRPLLRGLFFRRILAKQAFPKAKTFPAFDPAGGPATPADARPRLESAAGRFERACRARAEGDGIARTTTFGQVDVEDYARFTTLHTRHHTRQLPGG